MSLQNKTLKELLLELDKDPSTQQFNNICRYEDNDNLNTELIFKALSILFNFQLKKHKTPKGRIYLWNEYCNCCYTSKPDKTNYLDICKRHHDLVTK